MKIILLRVMIPLTCQVLGWAPQGRYEQPNATFKEASLGGGGHVSQWALCAREQVTREGRRVNLEQSEAWPIDGRRR